MGLFEVNVTVANPFSPERSVGIPALVDTGSTLSWLPQELLQKLGVRPISRSRFILADGSRIERETGIVLFTLDGKTMGVPVAFGESGQQAILGATALEALGFAVDPVEKKLIPRDLPATSAVISGFRSPVDSTGVPANMAGMLGETGIPTPDLSAAKDRLMALPKVNEALSSGVPAL